MLPERDQKSTFGNRTLPPFPDIPYLLGYWCNRTHGTTILAALIGELLLLLLLLFIMKWPKGNVPIEGFIWLKEQ